MEYHKQTADTRSVKSYKKIIFLVILISLLGSLPLFSYLITYKEQYYKLYHVHYQQYPDDVIENIEHDKNLIELRNDAKKKKDYDLADSIRNELLSKGIELIDTREGTIYREV